MFARWRAEYCREFAVLDLRRHAPEDPVATIPKN
jgi:hypothetical protein